MSHSFSIEESLRFGWQKTRQHSGLLFKVLLTLFAVQVAYAMVTKVLAHTLEGFLAALALSVASLIIGIGLTVITLKIAKNEPVGYGDILPSLNLVVRFVLASLLVGVITIVGLILLVIPGVYLMLRYFMVRFAIIEGASVTDSLRQSAALTRGHKWKLFGFLLVVIVLNIIGAILFLVGLLVSVPVTAIAYAHVYLKLKNKA